MASRSSAARNNILAGVFLLSGVALAVAVSVVLSGASDALQSSRTYTVLFSIAEGATGIKKGSSVLLGGQEIGKVRGVKFQPGPASLPPKVGSTNGDPAKAQPPKLDIAVEIATRAEFTFFTNAKFYLERPLLGSLSTINIADLGRPGVNGSTELAPGGSIRGSLAPPSFLAQAGVGDEQVTQVQELIASANRSAARVSSMIERYESKIDRIVDDADSTVHHVRERVPVWSADVDETLAGAKKLSPIADDVALGVKEGRDILRKAGNIVDDGAPKISTILTDAQSAMDKVNRETVDKFNRALDDAQKALDVLANAGNQFAGLMREESPNIRRLLANARLASDQLKFAAIEIRSQPWRLLYTPTPKETETSVLYDAARSYAQAVSDLRAASESLEATAAANSTPGGAPGAAQASDHETLERLHEELDRAFTRYRDAEKALLEILIKRGGESAPAEPKK